MQFSTSTPLSSWHDTIRLGAVVKHVSAILSGFLGNFERPAQEFITSKNKRVWFVVCCALLQQQMAIGPQVYTPPTYADVTSHATGQHQCV